MSPTDQRRAAGEDAYSTLAKRSRMAMDDDSYNDEGSVDEPRGGGSTSHPANPEIEGWKKAFKAQQDLLDARQKEMDLRGRLASRDRKLDDFERTVRSLTGERDELATEVTRLKGVNQDLESEITRLRNELAQLQFHQAASHRPGGPSFRAPQPDQGWRGRGGPRSGGRGGHAPTHTPTPPTIQPGAPPNEDTEMTPAEPAIPIAAPRQPTPANWGPPVATNTNTTWVADWGSSEMDAGGPAPAGTPAAIPVAPTLTTATTGGQGQAHAPAPTPIPPGNPAIATPPPVAPVAANTVANPAPRRRRGRGGPTTANDMEVDAPFDPRTDAEKEMDAILELRWLPDDALESSGQPKSTWYKYWVSDISRGEALEGMDFDEVGDDDREFAVDALLQDPYAAFKEGMTAAAEAKESLRVSKNKSLVMGPMDKATSVETYGKWAGVTTSLDRSRQVTS
ncbi:hypothetical protein ONZ51_g7820 [Trametes cubensis]|uniref:Uncharacterized protein n=1 Tax=Trametes cubensis TaxID=1111947 RepID=A0AAD7TRZ9_9APHY|nr:hypothetical protein ONZ51_g7820 [Trametes cubensis]